jgi:L-threonylcarbamoyladenylate synthase
MFLGQEDQLKTKLFVIKNPLAAKEEIKAAARILMAGGLVAFPTETVYGLGANALDVNAVEKIFLAKGRPADNPLIVHVAEASAMEKLAMDIPAEAYVLAAAFWPGPLTLVLKKRDVVPDVVTGGLDSVAVRIPDHPVALALLRAAGVPVAAPSANISGRPSPTTARHVLDDLTGRIDAVVDGGSCDVGVESTVLDIRDGLPLVLRPGGVTPAQIATVLGKDCPVAVWQKDSGDAPPSPGLKYLHYSPAAPMYVVRGSQPAVTEEIRTLNNRFRREGKQVGLLLSAEMAATLQGDVVEVLGQRDDAPELAANLYSCLRRLDKRGVDVIVAEGYREEGLGLALMNRMKKAAGPRIIDTEV